MQPMVCPAACTAAAAAAALNRQQQPAMGGFRILSILILCHKVIVNLRYIQISEL
jgi:hypothetical protein